MASPHDFTGRVALVTGGATGIGRAVVQELAAAGAIVGIHCNRSRQEADQLLAEIRGRGGDGLVLQADLTSADQATAAVDDLAKQFGRLDVLVNNAGSPVQRASLADCPLELWESVLATNLTSAFIVTQRAIPYLRASKRGAIVNNLTLSIQTGGSGGAGPYAIAKGGLQVMTRTLARELAPDVRVNAIMPGVIETRHHEQFSTAEKMEQYRRETPLGRNGLPAEAAAAVLFLASDAASFVTGALLDISGGRFLR